MVIMVQQALQGSNVNNNGANAINPAVPVNPDIKVCITALQKADIINPDIIILGGNVIVAGGFDGQAGTDSIEILKINRHPLRWTMFDGKLPVKLAGHDATVYQDKLYIIEGHNWNEKKTSDAPTIHCPALSCQASCKNASAKEKSQSGDC
ncbi:hypothetical protein C1645_806302 [Paramuricea clavata]|uniref:Uncharacterized protein n=1 Tax=Paramuricea clavata TaxID=317549 RepID=A0A7D9ESV1_PARCT|nr:hypothetical protein C1645_806302 [Paramuricea clavata]